MKKRRFRSFCCVKVGAALLLVSLVTSSALAYEVAFGDDVKISLDTTLSYGSAWRVEEAETSLLNSTGNSRFDSGDQTLSTFGVLVDADLNWKDDYGVFARGRAMYDTVYERDAYRKDARDVHGKNAELLDAFVYGNFNLGNLPLNLRVGRQSVFWGESLLVFGSIATAMNPLDITKSNAPGAETRELILPTGQVYGQISTPDSSLTLASYYKWEWEKSVLDEYGTYFSTNDALDDAGENFGPFPRGADRGEDDGDEYGVALRYLTDNGDEYGLYALNYRESLPMAMLDLAGSNYYLEYQDNVHLYGASYSTVINATSSNLAVEISYRPNVKVGMATPLPSYEEAELLQVQSSIIHMFGDVGVADNATLYLEWGYNRVLDFKTHELAKDQWATGGKSKLKLSYFNIAQGLDLEVPISVAYNPKGVTAYTLSGFNEGAHSISIGTDFTYLNEYKVLLSYTTFLGDADDNSKTDRDYVALNLKYTF